MKKKISAREKLLILVLAAMVIVLGYMNLFYNPTKEKITTYEADVTYVGAQIATFEQKVQKMNQMKAELATIEAEGVADIKELPAYDNSNNVMSNLNTILQSANKYNINFAGTSETDGIVRRNISLSFETSSYSEAKNILLQIYNGEYRCLLKDIYVSQSGGTWTISVGITYFEYK